MGGQGRTASSSGVQPIAPLDGSDECSSVGSLPSMKDCEPRGVEPNDAEERADNQHRRQQSRRRRRPISSSNAESEGRGFGRYAIAEMTQQSCKERSMMAEQGKDKAIDGSISTLKAPHGVNQRAKTSPLGPISPSTSAARSVSPQREDISSLTSTAIASSSSFGHGRHCGHRGGETGEASKTPRPSKVEIRNPVLEEEARRLDTLKRRRFMELQQTLTFELRILARKERDRLLIRKISAREAAVEARRSEMLEAAERARLDRERSLQQKGKNVEKEAATDRARQTAAERHMEAQDRLERRKAEAAIERRVELAAQRGAFLQARIARSVRVRRAQQLRYERLLAKKAMDKDAAAEAAKRAWDSEREAKIAAAAERSSAAHTAAEEMRRRRDEDMRAMQETAESKMEELENRVTSYRKRQKEIANRERELREEEAAELIRTRRETAQRKIEGEAKRRAEEEEALLMKEKEMALAREIQRRQEAARRRVQRREKEEQRKGAVERKVKGDEERRELIRRKLEEGAAKVQTLQSEKERLRSTRGQLSKEMAKQRETLQRHFGALKEQSKNCSISYSEITAAVAAAAAAAVAAPEGRGTRDGNGEDQASAASMRCSKPLTPRPASSRSHRGMKLACREIRPATVCAFPPPSQCSSVERYIGAGGRAVPHPPLGSPSSVAETIISKSLESDEPIDSGASTASETGGDGDGGLGDRGKGINSPPCHSQTTNPRQTPKKYRNATNMKSCGGRRGGGSVGGVARLRKLYTCKIMRRNFTTKGVVARRRKIERRGKTGKAMGGAYGAGVNGNALPTGGRNSARPSTSYPSRRGPAPAPPAPPPPRRETEQEGEVMNSDERYDGGHNEDDGDSAAAAMMAVLSPIATVTSPPPPLRVTGSVESGVYLLRRRYDEELMAILEEEKAAESARESELAAARARVKVAQARLRSCVDTDVSTGTGPSAGLEEEESLTIISFEGNDDQEGDDGGLKNVYVGVDRGKSGDCGRSGCRGDGGVDGKCREQWSLFASHPVSINGTGISNGGRRDRQDKTTKASPSTTSQGLVEITATPGKDSPTGAETGCWGRDLQNRGKKEEEVAMAVRDASRLERALARERRDASERVLTVSSAYERALEKLSCRHTHVGIV